MILFSTSQLLRYYRRNQNFPIILTDFKSTFMHKKVLTKQYDDEKKVYLSLKENSPVLTEYQESLKNMKTQIKTILQKMLYVIS